MNPEDGNCRVYQNTGKPVAYATYFLKLKPQIR
jgi:hypothetical protein